MLKALKYCLILLAMVLVTTLVSGCSFRKGDEVFFSGTKKLLVCEKPYIGSGDCLELNVKNNDNEEFVIYFDNSAQIKISDIFCSTTDNDDKVCQGKDSKRNLWDVYKAGTVF